MERVIDFISERNATLDEFERAHPYPFLVLEESPGAIEKATFSFRTQLTDGTQSSEQIRRVAALRKEGKRLSGAAEQTVFRVRKRPGSNFAQRISFGRTVQCDLSLPDSRISKLHAYFELSPEGDRLSLVECGSRNGTKVDGHTLGPEEKVAVRIGSQIEFGPFCFRLMSARQFFTLMTSRLEDIPATSDEVSVGSGST